MEPGDTPIQRVRFGAFEADLRAGEIFRQGRKIKLQGQPFQVLSLLLKQPGEVVTREELRGSVWPGDTFVDFDQGLNTAILKIREALGDDAANPSFVETLPRRGYRFIAQVELVGANGDSEVAPQPAAEYPQPQPTQIEPPPQRGRISKWKWAAGAAFVVLIALGAVIFHFQSSPTPPVLAFQRRDWVLVSRFENRTGNPVLNGTVDFAVAQELSNSKFVNVVPPQRIGDALHLMEKPLNTPLTPDVAREVCLRDGGIQALITGRVEKIGTTYDLSAGIVNPATGVQVAGVEFEAADLNGILPAVHQLSNQLRAALGEDLSAIQESNLKLEKVTTPSLRALQLYSQADTIAINQGPQQKPIPLLEQALANDPNFASAHILLAWCYSNIGKFALAAPHFQKAFELASTVSERERLFIAGSYYQQFKGNQAKAIQQYEALVHLYPDDFWGTNNLSHLYRETGRRPEWENMLVHSADLRPTSFRVAVDAWQSLLDFGFRSQAQHFFLRARKLLTPDVEKEDPDGAWAVRAEVAELDLETGKIKLALDLTQKLAITANPHSYGYFTLYKLYVELGKIKLAEKWLRSLPPGSTYWFAQVVPQFSAELAYYRGDLQAERRVLERPLTKSELQDGSIIDYFLQCGMMRQARQQILRYGKWYPAHKTETPWLPEWGKGRLALAEGHDDEAIRLLTRCVDLHQLIFPWQSASAQDDLATAYEHAGKIADAIRTLKPWQAKHDLNPQESYHLYKLYLKAGDEGDAQKLRADLLHRLAYADPDYPVLVELRHEGDHRVAALAKH